jgi:hypothetical protein
MGTSEHGRGDTGKDNRTAHQELLLEIKRKKRDSDGTHRGHHHNIELGFVAGVDGSKVRVSANAAIAVTLEEERSGRPVDPSPEA